MDILTAGQFTREQIERWFVQADVLATDERLKLAEIPAVNLGDKIGEDVLQALVDAYAIHAEKKSIDGLVIALVGDLKNTRAAHALALVLSKFRVEFSFVAPAALAMPIDICDELRERDFVVEETNDLAKTLRRADVVYMTGVRREHFTDAKQYAKMKTFFVLTPQLVREAKPGFVILHPFPHGEEISAEVDALPNAAYFRQAQRGLFMRMAVLNQAVTVGRAS